MSSEESGIILGESSTLPTVEPIEFHAILTNIGMILCYESKKDADGVEYWEMPLILETVTQRNPNTGEIQRSQGFRPLVPLTKDTKFKPLPTNTMAAVEIIDPKMENAYRMTVRDIRAQLSGIVMPSQQPVVGEGSGTIVTPS